MGDDLWMARYLLHRVAEVAVQMFLIHMIDCGNGEDASTMHLTLPLHILCGCCQC